VFLQFWKKPPEPESWLLENIFRALPVDGFTTDCNETSLELLSCVRDIQCGGRVATGVEVEQPLPIATKDQDRADNGARSVILPRLFW